MQLTKRIYSNLDLRKEKLKNYGVVVTTIDDIIEPIPPINFDISDEFLGLDVSVSGLTIVVDLPQKELLFVGKKIEIVDIGGFAGSSNIQINGNGSEINGNNNAIINTDYGSITMRYIGEKYGWRIIGFVN